VLEHSARKLQLFHVHNGNLRLQSHEEPAAHFLHPLGEITKFYDIVANDAAWLTDALE
jgi:hypothetical protein